MSKLMDSINASLARKAGKEAAKKYEEFYDLDEFRKPVFLNNSMYNFYFGEVNNKKKPVGCGLFHDEQHFVMFENIVNSKGNGMTIVYPLGADKEPFLCMSEDGNPSGPILYVLDQEAITLTYILNGSTNGFYFNVTPDGDYVIGRYFSGSEKSITLKYKDKDNTITYSDSQTGRQIKIPVSKNFKYNFHKRMYVEPFPYNKRKVSPARIEQAHQGKSHEYAYYGGITSYGGNVKTNGKIVSTNDEYGYGMVPLKNKDFYFGAFFEGKFSGTGCYRRASDNIAFMGQFSDNQKHGNIVAVYDRYSYELSSYYYEKKDGVSFIIKDNILYIQPYNKNVPVDYYFKFEPTMEKLEKYSLNNQLLETFILPKEKLSDDELKKLLEEAKKELKEKQKEKSKKRTISKSEAAALTDYEYEITKENKIKITKFKKKQDNIVKIPPCVDIIGSYCFKGCSIHTIEMANSITEVEENGLCDIIGLCSIIFSSALKRIEETFANSKNIKHIDFPKTIKSISLDAFTKCNKLEYVKLYKTTKYSKESFPSHCKIILIDEKKKEKKVKEKKPNIFKNIIGKIKDAIFERKLMSDFKVKSSKRKTRTKTKVKKDFNFKIGFEKFTIIQLIALAIVLFYMIAALTGLIVNMQDGLAKIPKWATSIKITYKFFFVNLSTQLFSIELQPVAKFFLFILFAIIVAISAIVDILVYAILGILLALLCLITYVIHLGLLAAIPLVVLVLEIIYYIKEVKDEEDSHLVSYLLIGLTSIATIIFYISFIHRAIYKY